ncbi:MAG: heavy-metal-associated domain-containing protein [Bacteroidia bacterium]
MTKTYRIEGMTCNGCVASVQDALELSKSVNKAVIQLDAPQAIIEFKKELELEKLQEIIGEKGNYTIHKTGISEARNSNDPLPAKTLKTYKPLILIIAFILLVSTLSQYPFSHFSGFLWMRHFMAGFFLVFAFFKLLNFNGFAKSYKMYDIVAAKWNSWGYVYPFIELGLGLLYLINYAPFYTNIATAVILGISTVGVVKSNLEKRKIKCACLGDVFNLPMSTVTIVEDVTMVAMALIMLAII